ncbi:hypothetical protein RchiOBHm_Chr4g0425901 [Rosa chinensis]|uniref:Uncharacterized protein n=1 Tax=Rosa chinensis TaxID=74649 RepID=A0A2P6QZ93_ROSCH|nr:hypothetical protein RchiOBHm_Chr4g0425901 [Rosa chinensis]
MILKIYGVRKPDSSFVCSSIKCQFGGISVHGTHPYVVSPSPSSLSSFWEIVSRLS